MHHLNHTTGSLTLIGSGEMTPGMARAHRRVMSQVTSDIIPAFLDTPAGFELNHEAISAKAVDYFAEQFQLRLGIASFANAKQATPLSMEAAMQTLRRANYIFAGPGSPTYTVRQLRNTPVFETIAAKLGAGAHVVFASAAALALGRHTLPVYEIYKVGADPHWTDGLDLLGRFSFDLAIVPHWNNNSGGSHDTSRCFIGKPRFEALQAQLPASTVVLGIDEYTACLISFAEKRVEVLGAGQVTLLRSDRAYTFGNGESFGFELLRQPNMPDTHGHFAHEETYDAFRHALDDDANPASALGYLHGLMSLQAQAGTLSPSPAQLDLMIREMVAWLAVWLEYQPTAAATPAPTAQASMAPFVNLLVDLRTQLRAAKQWALADAVRHGLANLGVVIEDTPNGARWKLG